MEKDTIDISFQSVKKYFLKDNFVLAFSLLALFSLIFSLSSFFEFSLGIDYLNKIVGLFSSWLWIALFISLCISSVLAYHGKWKWMFVPILIWLLMTTFVVRTANVDMLVNAATGEPELGPDLDPFLFLRHAKEIVEGRLENPDMMRRVPFGMYNYAYVNLEAWMIAAVYWAVNIFNSDFNVTQAGIYSTPVWFTLSIIPFFLLLFVLFSFNLGKRKSLVGAAVGSLLYAFSSQIVARSVAGVPESEGHAFLWLWIAFLFFALAWKQDFVKERKKLILYGVLAGLFTAIMAWTWGGYSYIFMIVALTSLLLFLFEKEKTKNLLVMALFVGVSFLLMFPIELIKGSTFFGSVFGLLTSMTDTGLAFAVLALLAVDFVVFRTKVKTKINPYLKKLKLPENLTSIIVLIVLGSLVLLIVRPSFLISFIPDFLETLLRPFGTGRVGVTVAEHRIPYLNDVLGNFGIFFWIFLAGLFFVFMETVKHFKSKQKILLNLGFMIFILTFTFSSIDPNHALDGTSGLSKLLYYGGIFLFGAILIYTYGKAYRDKDESTLSDFNNINFGLVFIVAVSILALFSLRVAIRFFLVAAPLMLIAISYLPLGLNQRAKRTKDETTKFFYWIVLVLVAVLLFYGFIIQVEQTNQRVQGMVPSVYHHQWHYAMDWVSENTPEDAVFAHWWDYGYWVQTMGERATLADGQYNNPAITHLLGRYLLTTPNPDSALSFLKTFGVTHLLIDSSDLGKYGAYSSIGSDEEGKDRRSWLPVMPLDPSQTRRRDNVTEIIFRGGIATDGDIIYVDREGNEIFLPGGRTGIGGISFSYVQKEGEISLSQPKGIFVYNNQRHELPIRNLFYDGQLVDFEEGVEATIVFIPGVSENAQGISIEQFGAAIYLSEKVKDSLFAQLYLMDDPQELYPTIETAHVEDDFIVKNLKQQGIDLGHFVYYNGFRGPIKIWDTTEIPEDIIEFEGFLISERWLAGEEKWGAFDDVDFRK